MINNKEIIIKVIFSLVFVIIVYKILAPALFSLFRSRIPGLSSHENDIDQMIRRQKERLRSQHGLQASMDNLNSDYQLHKKINKDSKDDKLTTTSKIQKVFHENKWGTGELVKKIQQEIKKDYSYSMTESRIISFINVIEKNHLFKYLKIENQESIEHISNYALSYFLLTLLTDEVKSKEFNLIHKISKKIGMTSQEMALGIQIKILMTLNKTIVIKEERIYSDQLTLHQYSDASTSDAIEMIASIEANLWATSFHCLFKEMELALSYAQLIHPFDKIKNKKDMATACAILGVSEDFSIEEIKKAYKKMALLKHPDKITSQRLPKALENKAIEKFNQIQMAYDLILINKKHLK